MSDHPTITEVHVIRSPDLINLDPAILRAEFAFGPYSPGRTEAALTKSVVIREPVNIAFQVPLN